MKRTAQAVWSGALKDGKGTISLQSGVLRDQPYSFKMRFEDESGKSGTNPEELIAAAHASCFTMQLSHFLAEAGYPAAKLTTDAEITIGPVPSGGQAISKSALTLRGKVPGMSDAQFAELANKAKAGCPVSKALGAIEITLDAKLEA
ncbi:MAG: OsmC family protein [Hyphomonadaceae bacterium]|nr:OsmC family protein [Hyphomonadaceae bacterium]